MIRIASFFISTLLMTISALAACGGGLLSDILCNAGVTSSTLDRIHKDIGKSADSIITNLGYTASYASKGAIINALFPVRQFLTAANLPPAGYAAYGLVVFQAMPTPASRTKARMICSSYISHFPRDEKVPASILLAERMTTVWPVDTIDPKLANDDCEFALDHYELSSAQLAMQDAAKQKAIFDTAGPFLVGWSPSNARGAPDKLVLVVDFTTANTQAEIDSLFLFWKRKIIDDPKMWQQGFSLERLRVAIQEFANEYGKSFVDAIKLVSGK